jgi:PAS domain S-box-containing protein
MGFWRKTGQVALGAIMALPVVFSAEVLRTWLLEARGLGLPFLTYYPAVLVAAVLGGLPGGLTATLLSALLTVFRIHQGRIPLAEAVAMGIFVASSIWVSAMAHARLRAGARAGRALADLERARADHESSEQALGATLAKLDALIQAVPDLVWLKDAEGVYQDCNEPFERFFGIPRENILGRSDYDLVDPALARTFRESDQQAMATGQVARGEETVALVPGEPKGFLETIRTPIQDPAGTVIGILGIGRDITQRKRD